jgi:hypothetical protein
VISSRISSLRFVCVCACVYVWLPLGSLMTFIIVLFGSGTGYPFSYISHC